MISIDFGNSYTKVAVRPDENQTAVPICDGSLGSLDREGLSFCIPTMAGRDSDGCWNYGTQVVAMASVGSTYYRNWKPQFFKDVDDGQAHPKAVPTVADSSPVNARSDSTEDQIRKQYAKFLRERLDNGDLGNVIDLEEFGARLRAGAPRVQTAVAEPVVEAVETDYTEMGIGFFSWLRKFVEHVCASRNMPRPSNSRARVTLPSFGGVAAAENRLKDILHKAGWNLDERQPTLYEPHANYWGIVSKGRNGLFQPKAHDPQLHPNLDEILRGSSLIARIREAGRKHVFGMPQHNWVLVADLGGFTVDFVMMALDARDPLEKVEGVIDGKPSRFHKSYAVGVQQIDAMLADRLPEREQRAIAELVRDNDQSRLEQFHRNILQHDKKFAAGGGVVIGNTAQSREIIKDTRARFADDVVDKMETFLVERQYDRVDEFIITGGGFNIPAVRDRLCQYIYDWASERDLPIPYAYVPAKALDRAGRDDRVARQELLQPRLVRGASALGGASVVFDYDD